MPDYRGIFETHITVEAPDAAAIDRFRMACASIGVKPILIALSDAIPRQPMTQSVSTGALPAAKESARRIATELETAGFRVVRLKIEAAPDNDDIPQTDNDALRLPNTHYFEYHLKMVLRGTDTVSVRALCTPHGGHVSHNAFKHRDDDHEERFITVRCPGVGRETAEARFAALQASLAEAGFFPVKSVCEYCVFDTNIALDEEWLEI